MAFMTIPAGGLELRGSADADESKPGASSAIAIKLSDDMVQDVRKAASTRDGAHFISGYNPRIRLGGRNIDLRLSTDAFRHELFAASNAAAATDLSFVGLVSHRAELADNMRKSSGGTERAMQQLNATLALCEQEKKARQANYDTAVLPAPKNRYEAARQEKLDKKRGRLNGGLQSVTSSPTLNGAATPNAGQAPSSAPQSEEEIRARAMRIPVIHLLAIRPLSSGDIRAQTHIPRDELEGVLSRLARKEDGKWNLLDRPFKELDVWEFGYPSQEERQLAIDNAIRALDRQRVDKGDDLWQALLPKEERGKGVTLSRLGGGGVNRSGTPSHQRNQSDGAGENKPASTMGSPHIGTPRPSNKQGDVMKRLLAKDPKKARAAAEAKERKQKEREAAASDRENAKAAKRTTATGKVTKTTTAKTKAGPAIKSAEIVHSSDDESEEEGEVTKQPPIDRKTGSQASKAKAVPPPKPKPTQAASTDSSDSQASSAKPLASARPRTATAKPTANTAVKPSKPAPTGKNTPQPTPAFSAPNSQQKPQRSPQTTKPHVPSPLGAARPRVASDVSDNNANGNGTTAGSKRPRQPATEGPAKGLGITASGSRKRHDTVTSTSSGSSQEKPLARESSTTTTATKKPAPKVPAAAAAATSAPSKANGNTPANGPSTTATTKRKAPDPPAASPPPKHRKITSTSSTSGLSSASSTTAPAPAPASARPPISYARGASLAQAFRDRDYPRYERMWDEQKAIEERGGKVSEVERRKLWQLQRKLERVKREIWEASELEG